MLREEVLSLKNEVLRHAGCGFWAVDKYLARYAGDLLGIEVPSTLQSPPPHIQGPGMPISQPQEPVSFYSSPDMNDFSDLELLRGFDQPDISDLE